MHTRHAEHVLQSPSYHAHLKNRTNSRSTSAGVPSGRLEPRRDTTIAPISPAYVSAASSAWEWYLWRGNFSAELPMHHGM